MDIGARAKKILHAVVSEYLATGEAVGSQTVTRRYGLEVSAATVRTVMGDLEEAGLLKHAHTSGGPLPTERGLRYYVDMLLRVRSLTTRREGRDSRAPRRPGGDVPDVMQRTSRLLRELSHLTVVVQAPRPESDVVQHLEFVQLREGQLLAVIAAASGQIQNKLVPIDFTLSAERSRSHQQLPERADDRADAGAGARPPVRRGEERSRHARRAGQPRAAAGERRGAGDAGARGAGRRSVEPARGEGRSGTRQAAAADAGGEGPGRPPARPHAERARASACSSAPRRTWPT